MSAARPGRDDRRMLESIPAELKSDALPLLQFLVHSKRPLRLAEAVEVIATQIEGESAGFDVKRRLFREGDVLGYCPSLVVVVHTPDEELHLSHFSVKEYLLGNDQLKLPTASISITRTCLAYRTDIEGDHSEIKQKFPMARFAAEVWIGFAASAESVEEVLEATTTFIQGEVTFQTWCRLYQHDRDWNENPGPAEGSRLYYACLGGLCRTAGKLLEAGADVNAQGGYDGNALRAASARGNIEIAKLLLEAVADVDSNALQDASVGGHIEIVKLLLAHGAEMTADIDNMTPVHYTVSTGNEEIAHLFLDAGVSVDRAPSWCRCAPRKSASGGSSSTEEYRTLRTTNAPAEKDDKRYRTSCCDAADSDNSDARNWEPSQADTTSGPC